MLQDSLLEEKLLYPWCTDYGNGIALHAILSSIDRLGWTYQDVVVATGIGYWGKVDDYVKTNTFHGAHGQALAFSTGIRPANPRLHILAPMGDGDGIITGGNHLIHTARRNVDVTAIMVNNLSYRMTGGQYSGTTPKNVIARTLPYGHMEQSFDVCNAAKAVSGSLVTREIAVDTIQPGRLTKQAISHKGFSFMEVVSPCLTHHRHSNKSGKAPAVMEQIKEDTVSDVKASSMNREELKGKFVTGIIENREQEDYSIAYQHVIDELRGGEAQWEDGMR